MCSATCVAGPFQVPHSTQNNSVKGSIRPSSRSFLLRDSVGGGRFPTLRADQWLPGFHQALVTGRAHTVIHLITDMAARQVFYTNGAPAYGAPAYQRFDQRFDQRTQGPQATIELDLRPLAGCRCRRTGSRLRGMGLPALVGERRLHYSRSSQTKTTAWVLLFSQHRSTNTSFGPDKRRRVLFFLKKTVYRSTACNIRSEQQSQPGHSSYPQPLCSWPLLPGWPNTGSAPAL